MYDELYKKVEDFKPYHKQTAIILLDCIAGATYNCVPTITYTQIEQYTKRHRRADVPHDIADLSVFCFRNKMPMISAIVVGEGKNIPGDGFYDLWRKYYNENNTNNSEIYQLELKRVMEYEHWYRLADMFGIGNESCFRSKPLHKKVRKVSLDEIGTAHNFTQNVVDLKQVLVSRDVIEERTNRHQTILKKMACLLVEKGYKLHENPIDCLAISSDLPPILIEVKTLDGSYQDEIRQVRLALSQILYYDEFYSHQVSIPEKFDECEKVILFEHKIKDLHIHFLEKHNCLVAWIDNDKITFSQDNSLNFLY